MHFSSHHSQIVGISIKRLMAFWKCSNTSNFLAFSHQTYFTMTAFYSELWPQQAPLQLETETFSFLFFSFSFEILHFNEDLRCSNRIIWCVFVRPIIIISHHMHSHKLNDREGEKESACVRSAINSLKCACAFSIKHEISIPSHQFRYSMNECMHTYESQISGQFWVQRIPNTNLSNTYFGCVAYDNEAQILFNFICISHFPYSKILSPTF